MTGSRADVFLSESGGHRWQRIPPTERRGRVHTSTVTVYVEEKKAHTSLDVFNECDVVIRVKRGSGKGGQHRNRTESCVVATHTPTGISSTIDGRDQHQNKRIALELLKKRVEDAVGDVSRMQRASAKNIAIGSGQRGDKIRTYRTQDDVVVDARTGEKMSLKAWLKGKWEWA